MDEDILADVAEDWQIVLRVLPLAWQDQARELGALRRHREFPDAATLLRVFLIHLAEGLFVARDGGAGGGRTIGDSLGCSAAQRLRVSGEWFRWMGEELMRRRMTPRPVRPHAGCGPAHSHR
jgi:hypothetical protein